MKNKAVSIISVATLVIILCGVMLCMTACGKDVTVKVNDLGVTTEVDANTEMTVQEVLDKAEITLGKRDNTEPKLGEKLGDITEITVKRYAKVTVKKGNTEKVVELVGGKVSDAVKKAGFKLKDGLVSDIDKASYLEDKMIITLTNSVEVSLTADGKTDKYKTYAKTVKEFLEEKKITLDKDDEVSHKLNDKISAGMKIIVKRIEYKQKTVKESIGFETKEQQNNSLSSDQTQVKQEGINGEKEVTYKVKYVDGKEDSRLKISEKVTKEPVDKIVIVGTATQSGQNPQQGGKQIVSKQKVNDCDGSGHGYYIITYSDGSVEYEDY